MNARAWAQTQAASPPPDPAALVRAAEDAYARGDCDAAVRDWRAAYALTRDRALLSRIVQCPEPLHPTTTAPPATTMPVPEGEDLGSHRRATRRAVIALGALGVAALGLGVGFAISAEALEDEVEQRAADGRPYDPALAADGRRDAEVARGAFIAAGALGVAAAVVYWLVR